MTAFSLPHYNQPVIDFLSERRSNLARTMTGPGPSAEERDQIIRIAARVPDHRKLEPWRFIIFEGEAREAAGNVIAKAFARNKADRDESRIQFEADRFLRAPLIIAVVSAPVDCPRSTPRSEQVLSAGAVCFAMIMAAQSMGYASQWLTEWYAYDPDVLSAFGLDENETIAGFIYIGQTETVPQARRRPDMMQKITSWEPG